MYFYPKLGSNGRLGNQMFQYAALYAVSKFHNSKAGIPDIDCELYKAFPNISAEKVDDVSFESAKYDFVPNEGLDFSFAPNLFTCRDNTRISGYFQSELYFNMFSDDIKKEFQFSNEVIKDCSEEFARIKKQSNDSPVCAVHFRRGDYTKLAEYHTNLDASYYNPAFSWMLSNIQGCRFLAISDDYEWCRSNLPNDFLLPNSKSMFHDMCLMSMCDVHIIANSSFSWWAAWLSEKTKQVIAPSQWFGPKGPKKWDTIYSNGWGII